MVQVNDQGETFGAWLLAQRDRDGLVGQLVDGAKADRRFPRNGSPEDIRKHLSAMQAEGDLFEAVDEAETDWLSY
ncbi:YozE family protein [Sphingomonas abietis]|uniref:YozE family protein n=1 Tax=Sphingomonas abietis TaxID=3012344 RepID=A0ABY7NR79_9SPHN|nr:YozE family protein [Sphingomonas abietis]WBO21996.1 YozE family protein [Sphingomonas abietis]